MPTPTVLQVLDLGDDRLEILGYLDGLDDGMVVPLRAYGWRSALEQHPVDDTRDEAGHRTNTDTRPMTDDERLAYCKAQLVEQNQLSVPTAAPSIDLGIAG